MSNIQYTVRQNIIRISLNSGFVFLSRIVDMAIALIATALIARYLSIKLFGYYAFVMAIAIFIGPVINFGFERITTREIARDPVTGEHFIGTALIARIFLSVFIVCLACFVIYISGLDPVIAWAILIAILNNILLSNANLAVSTFQAFERMEYQLGLKFIFNLLYLGFVITVIKLDYGFLSLFFARTLSDFMQAVVMLAVAFRYFIKPRFEINFRRIAYLLKEGYPLWLYSILLTASFKVDVFVLNSIRGPADVSLFEAAHRIIMQLQLLSMSFVIALFPYFSRLVGEFGNELRLAFYKIFKLFLILSLPITILLIFGSDAIITLLFGIKFAAASRPLAIMAWVTTFLFLISLQNFVMTSQGRQLFNAISAAVCFLINFALDVCLVPEYGYIGASYATLIAYAIFFLLSFYFITRSLGVPPLISILPKPFLAAGGMGLLGILLRGTGGNLSLVLACGGMILLYGGLIVLLKSFTPEEMSVIRSVITRKNGLERQRVSDEQ